MNIAFGCKKSIIKNKNELRMRMPVKNEKCKLRMLWCLGMRYILFSERRRVGVSEPKIEVRHVEEEDE